MYNRASRTWAWTAVFGLILMTGCSDRVDSPTAVEVSVHEVHAADPNEAPRNNTLNVRVMGSGFEKGSTVRLLLAGQSAPKIVTNSSTFIDRNNVIANITIAADAEVAHYDIELITPRGKKGIGSEVFEVKPDASVQRFEESDMTLVGGWTLDSNHSHGCSCSDSHVESSGGDAVFTNDAGAYATLDFEGTGLFWLGAMTYEGGFLGWIVDEGTPEEVSGVLDTYFPANPGVSDRVALTTSLSDRAHTLKLVSLGVNRFGEDSRPSETYIDAIDVIKAPGG